MFTFTGFDEVIRVRRGKGEGHKSSLEGWRCSANQLASNRFMASARKIQNLIAAVRVQFSRKTRTANRFVSEANTGTYMREREWRDKPFYPPFCVDLPTVARHLARR